MTLKTFASLGALALSSLGTAQVSLPDGVSQCDGIEIESPVPASLSLQPRFQERPSPQGLTNLCSEYTHSGWKDTMRLYLGEGALEYKPWIELAVENWNEALMGFNRKPVIELAEARPRNFSLPDSFWDQEDELDLSRDLVRDRQSVIYLKGGSRDGTNGGFCHWRWDESRSTVEADMYINITDWEEVGPFLVKTQEILKWDGEKTHAAVDSTYLVILHEIGHALGLYHVPVSGNIMSYNYMPHLKDVWAVPTLIELLRQAEKSYSLSSTIGRSDHPLLSAFSSSDEDYGSYLYFDDPQPDQIFMYAVFTLSAGLGEQDRTALLCAYEFDQWNH